MSDTFLLTMSDGDTVVVHSWLPLEGEPRAVIQLTHGGSEHGARYAGLAAELTKAGYAVYADDHRGHGRSAGTLEHFGVVGPNGWNRLIDDAKDLTDHVTKTHPGLPVIALGHSMGSFLVQGYLQRWGHQARNEGLRGAVLTGTASSLSSAAEGLRERANGAIARDGRDIPSTDFAMLFVNFNDPFVDTAPASGPTGFEWLSRDQDEVRAYVDDPWCGFPLSNGFVADMAAGLEKLWAADSEGRIPGDLPVLIMAGGDDPVGQSGESVRQLVQRYHKRGLAVTERLYPGARHELFNEINREEVHRDLLRWLDGVVG